MQTGFWKTKDGSEIRICDMDNAHLVHAILFLEKMAIQRQSDPRKFSDFVRPVYWCMLEEIESRLSTKTLIGYSIINNRLVKV
jgi:hypothetical protein